MVFTETLLTRFAINQRIAEVRQVAARFEDLRRTQNSGVNQNNIITLLNHGANPRFTHITKHQRAQRAVVIT